MVTFWTVLLINFNVQGADVEAKLLFPSMKTCGEALEAIYYDYVYSNFTESMAQCNKSDIISNSPRPKPRP